MKRTLFAAAVALLLSAMPAAAQQAIPGQSFGFDYLTADFTQYSVTRFEMQVDGGAWTDIQVPEIADDANTLPAAHTYKVAIPPLATGAHTVSFRACNANPAPNNCSAASAPLNFNMVVFTAPGNTRILSGGE